MVQAEDSIPVPLRILHLEDEPEDAELVRLRLKADQMQAAITVVDSRAGFESALAEGEFHLVLADFSTPELDGLAALEIAAARAPDAPFILVSGSLSEELTVKSIKQGATDYVLKDQLTRLAPSIRRALREVRERKARRQADEELRRSRQEIADMVESSGEAIITKGLDGTIKTWNAGAQRLFGYRTDEAQGRPIFMLLPPERYEEERLVLARIARDETVDSFESIRLRKDGLVLQVSVTVSPIKNAAGEVIGASTIARDITAAKAAGEALRASEHLYRLLFNSNPTPVYLFDQETLTFMAVNEAAIEHYGYSRPEFLGMTLRELALPEETPTFVARLQQLPNEAGNSGIWRHRRKDGRLVEMEITAHPLMFAGRKSWLSLAADVTERLSLEAQLRQSQKMESVGQLAGGIAHDFNNLLTVINGHTGLLLAQAGLPSKVTEPLKEISEAARRASELTRQLLTFSRKNVMQLQIVDLNEVVTNVGKMLRRILGEDIALKVNYSPNLPAVKADLGMLEQVLLNLAVNSRDAMPRGGQLHITTSSVMIDSHRAAQNPEASPGRYVCLALADTGCGIPPENLPRIFEPFFTTKEIDRGTGLGLATVYGIVKQHQGWIQVTSEVRRGTTFEIHLPASSEKGGAVSLSSAEQRVIGGTETILVVEDEAPLLKLIQHILESYGYKVLGCSSGRAALEQWEQDRRKIELVLTDMILPDGMAGPELVELLQASKPDLKVVFMSGYNTEKLARDYTLSRHANFIQKPFHARKLAETVYDCINSKNAAPGPAGAPQ